MPYIAPEIIAEVKQMDLLTYLKTYEPHELVHFSGNTYTTKSHDSLKISNGKAKLFDPASVDYKIGLQIYKGFLEKIGAQKDVVEVYEEFDKVYEASVNGQTQDKEKTRGGR